MITIINGDIFDGLKKIQDGTVDLIFIDPPYNLKKKYADDISDRWESDDQYIIWVYKWLDIALEKLSPNGSLYIMNTTQNMPYIDIYLREKIYVKSRIVWTYDSSGVQAKKHFGSLYEPILFCTKHRTKYTFNRRDILIPAKTGSERNLTDYRKNPPEKYNSFKVPGNVWDFSRVRYRMKEYVEHPSQKPEVLLERIVKASSNENDVILDLFAGTFSLGRVAQRLNRKYIGIELSKSYCKTGSERLKGAEIITI
ncbi:adenine-specific DNA-methyltransferase [Enterococcus hirae]|uniref:adenine-specific DNA-methyltransferase n=1 Tax=Enterococcus sp. C63 TaxID=3231324 RepID=UPI001A0E628B|nr:adenine-specific DNA-methyltransferase [Enterococcus hirae]EMF0129091.1 adenine-specific DNA-methyltransferase [Enterococcus hirae]EMF0448858.1 adenine-specific DNA-methyltransferase [Enterococcus hirae]EMF0516925.1 adenine-specific DNA-methyltransferase [Enterococcus hirae]EMF0518401.1 adenine-specific DNA-methyltransferase [Enterococcus hirae]